MATSAHHLRRLRLQVHSADQASAQALRSQFEAGLSRRLADVVAAVCDELGPEEELLRLDRLDLPLGAFALEELEREAPLALERVLRDALLQALAAARHNPAPGQRLLAPAEARLDRLATFLRLGLVPHRVASEPFAPADDLLALLRADPANLLALLRRLAGERSALERLLLQLDPERFALLLAALAPADAALILAYLADLLLLHQQRPLLPLQADRLRLSLWLVTLTLLLRDAGSTFNRRTFLDQLLRGLANEHRLAYTQLLQELQRALQVSRRQQPLGGSLPGLLAELIAQQLSLDAALVAAAADPLPLLSLLRANPTDPVLHRAVEPSLNEPLFEQLVQALEPSQAPLVIAYVADVAEVHRQRPLLPLSAAAFGQQVRSIALQLLLLPQRSAFERRSFLEQLLRQLAQSQRLAYGDLLRSLATALARLPQPITLQTSLPGLVAQLLEASQDGAGALPGTTLPSAADFSAATTSATTSAAPDPIRLPPDPIQAWITFFRSGHPALFGPRLQAAVERDPAGFSALLMPWLGRGDAATEAGAQGPIDPEALLNRLLRWLLPEGLALVAAHANARDPRPPALLFARWGEALADQPGFDLTKAWRQLLPQRLADPNAPLPALAATAAAHLDRLALLRQLLWHGSLPAWLALPPALDDLLAPLARASELDLLRLLHPLCADPPPATGELPSLRTDSLAPSGDPATAAQLLGASGSAPSGSAPSGATSFGAAATGGEPSAAAFSGAAFSGAALTAAELAPTAYEALVLALMRLQRLLDAGDVQVDGLDGAAAAAFQAANFQAGDQKRGGFDALLERLLPWLQQPSGPLAEALITAGAGSAAAVRLRAVATVLAGMALDPGELQRPLPDLPALAPPLGAAAKTVDFAAADPIQPDPFQADLPQPEPRQPAVPPSDRQRLLRWLAGDGPELPEQLPTLLRLFSQLADQGDPELDGLLRRGAARADQRQRWIRRLPEALLGRVVLRLQPGRGRLLLDLQALLALAWSQAAMPGEPRPNGLPWEALLELLASPQPLPTRLISHHLVQQLGGVDRHQPAAERLLRRARQLATEAKALPLLAALEPPSASDNTTNASEASATTSEANSTASGPTTAPGARSTASSASSTVPLTALAAITAAHLDRLALLRQLLWHGSLPAWLALPPAMEDLLAPLARASELDLLRLLHPLCADPPPPAIGEPPSLRTDSLSPSGDPATAAQLIGPSVPAVSVAALPDAELPPAAYDTLVLALLRLQRLLDAGDVQVDGLDGAAAAAFQAANFQAGDQKRGAFDALLERLLPWLQQPSGPLAEALITAGAGSAAAVRLRAVATVLAGMALDPGELQRPLPDLPALAPPLGAAATPAAAPAASPSKTDPLEADLAQSYLDLSLPSQPEPLQEDQPKADPPQPEARLPGVPPSDRQRLLRWLAGDGPELPEQLPTLLRLFSQLADQGDPELDGLLRRGAARADQRQRWIRRLPEALLGRVVLRLQPGRGRLLLDLLALLALAWSQAAMPGEPRPNGLPWEALLELLASPQPLPTRLISHHLVQQLGGVDRHQPAAERLLRRARQLATEAKALPLLAALEPPSASDTATNASEASTNNSGAPAPASGPSSSPSAAPDAAWSAALDYAYLASSGPEESLEAALAQGLYIANAGLVLFNPFLPMLFERLGLLESCTDEGKPAIFGLEQRSRAVHLLQWLVDGRLDSPEPDLVLNKLLAGIDIAAPILPSYSASEDELAIATDLLRAVIDHWPPLRNTSPAGLRETFLQREGRLDPPSLDQDHWSLQVQRRTVDILIDQIPWSITMLLHRWMAAPLQVSW